eukprot:CAMPEP_0204651652 /NCGR_PEP_ID=MMETSP0718-20130828/13731_1 /ASSEMBLY_ACC=CAM_ASM_000674 /TAXON_ID=230516 /ORGANISM="Chaetoceros curvisetus" /LENGTH=66 /DNA_ID=CAMNT_0051675457 /DNA_START=479 /DNA_END=676 /DNA_ORIENTATION=-
MACCSGSYLARPKDVLILVLAVFLGTGILTTTCVAKREAAKFAMTLRLMETLLTPCISRTAGMILK